MPRDGAAAHPRVCSPVIAMFQQNRLHSRMSLQQMYQLCSAVAPISDNSDGVVHED